MSLKIGKYLDRKENGRQEFGIVRPFQSGDIEIIERIILQRDTTAKAKPYICCASAHDIHSALSGALLFPISRHLLHHEFCPYGKSQLFAGFAIEGRDWADDRYSINQESHRIERQP